MRERGISFGNDDRLDRRHTMFYFQWFAFQNPVLHTSYKPQGSKHLYNNIRISRTFIIVFKSEVCIYFSKIEVKLAHNHFSKK